MRSISRWAALAACLCLVGGLTAGETRPTYQTPYAVAVAPDGGRLYVSHHTAGTVSVVDPAARKVVATVAVGGEPTGLALSADGKTLYAANGQDGSVAVVDARAARLVKKLATGSPPSRGRRSPASAGGGGSAFGLTLTRDGKTLYACDRFLNRINVVDTARGQVVHRLSVTREPLFCDIEPDGKTLWVSNLLPLGPSTDERNAAVLDLYDAASRKHLGEIKLVAGATDVHQIACSPDGRWVYVVHVLARFNIPPTQLERGWVNNSAVTVIDAHARKIVACLLLDEVSHGCAQPFAAVLTPDGKTLVVSFFGVHELAFIDLPAMHERLAKARPERLPELTNELSLLRRWECIRRCETGGRGPRGVAIGPKGETAYVANTWSDSLGVVDIAKGKLVGTIALGPKVEPDIVRRGEMFFNDATLCFQRWQSCASCHPDARVDGLNWDLLNDGIGNPKNARSMLLSHRTPPVMASAVRAKAEIAVRAGFRYILFHDVVESEAKAVDEYLKALKPRPSPYLNGDGSMTAAATRGKALFESTKTGCAACHTGELYTDLKSHDVGTRGPLDRRDAFDNPTLREIWRTGPSLHDGRAVTLRDVLTIHNKGDRHGRTSHLSKQQIDDLVAFLLSL